MISVEQQPATKTRQHPRQHWRKPRLLTLLLLLLTALALIHFIAVTHTAYPTITSTTCLSLIRNTDYTQFVSWQPEVQEMNAVQFVDDLTRGQPSALVEVRSTSPQRLLDVYIYGCSRQQHIPTLTLLFKKQGLIEGTAAPTRAHTLSISQLDIHISTDTATLLLPQQQNIYQEYGWNNTTFTQVKFSALYPVLSRGEAETLQEQTNSEQKAPWTSPTVTAEMLAQDIFHWPTDTIQSTLLDNAHSIAHVLLTQTKANLTVTITLTQLIQDNDQGLWFVTEARTPHIALTQQTLPLPVTSPMTLQGTVTTPAPATLTVQLFDHTFNPIRILNNADLTIQTTGLFSGTLSYTNSVSNQPALLLLETHSGTDSMHIDQFYLTNIMLD